MTASLLALLLIGTVALVGLASALACLRARRFLEAAGVVLAAAGLIGLVGGPSLPGWPARTEAAPMLAASPPAPAADDLLRLDFPRQLALGRSFALTLQRSGPPEGWRLQLLDENGALLAQAPAAGGAATVRWLPPVAEALVLQARVLDAAGQTVSQGPVPLEVMPSRPLQVQGRFGAPSFDTQALHGLLQASQANLDWQLTLGKTVTRAETPLTAMATPDLLVIDAAQFERLAASARAALLAQVGQGLPLLVLAGNARDAALWARELQLPLNGVEPVALPVDTGLELMSAPLRPALGTASPWRANSSTEPWLWQRPWQQGRILWLGVVDWHRHAINAPERLGGWWQQVLDQAQLQQRSALQWVFPEPMPLAGERSVVCARGAAADLAVQGTEATAGLPVQGLQLQRRADRADDACAALWPTQAGWLRLQPADPQLPPGRLYVFAPTDWPQWQRALRRDDSMQPAKPTPTPLPSSSWPSWLCALLFSAALLGLWWRERR